MWLPEDFTEYMRRMLGAEEYAMFAAALEKPSPVSIRYNSRKWTKEHKGKTVEWCQSGFYLDSRPTFTFDPVFHAGGYYVQEASSMFLDYLLRKYVGSSPVVALDLCAAPGGKSTLAVDALPEGSLLVANEVVRQRANVLAENMTKWGNPNVIVTHNQASEFQALGSVFDVIVCDAPCSGEGMFRKDEQAIKEWSVGNVDTCYRRQREILGDVWQCLKPGGLLVYSTCTYNMQEDEENVLWMKEELGAEVLPCCAEQSWNIAGSLLEGCDLDVCHFFPHRNEGEGFFISILRKPEDAEWVSPQKKCGKRKDKKKVQSVVVPKELKGWLKDSYSMNFMAEGDKFVAFPACHSGMLDAIRDNLTVLCYGVTLATVKGKTLQPSHSLAMSALLDRQAFSMVELTYEQAIAYLRTEAVTLPVEAERGFVIVTYHDTPLGFVKNLGNRANNLYPQEWRIRSGHLPETVVCV
ncbi:MAG: rRNA cytosine-C5-methyltransferase [Bacteroides sp.]|nr:hypothetical protein [Roseburia sp.]MCM1347338.1 rRNA cytosine-C5-methyltransferase [Bacteroides sp.]MCM1421832.1 rRNA cytosine-C5-methyltransferase [Bacteroides sp.]